MNDSCFWLELADLPSRKATLPSNVTEPAAPFAVSLHCNLQCRLKSRPSRARLPGNIMVDLLNLLDQPILSDISTQLHIGPVCPGLQARVCYLSRPFLLRNGIFKNNDVFFLGSNFFHNLMENTGVGEAALCYLEINRRDRAVVTVHIKAQPHIPRKQKPRH